MSTSSRSRAAVWGGIAPLAWGILERDDPIIRKLLGEALELDLGADGVTIPLRGRDGEYGLFSVCFRGTESSGPSRHALMRRLMVASGIFHSKIRRAFSVPDSHRPRLTDRELACLRLRAFGKTDDEIGVAIGASSSAARFWLEAARAGLGVATVAAAVEKAAATGAIETGEARPSAPVWIHGAPSIAGRGR